MPRYANNYGHYFLARLPPWIFNPALKCKLRLPLFDETDKPFCPCGRHNDPFGDHIFQCRRINKIGAHNFIRDGFANTLGPLLTTAGYLLPSSTLDIEPQLHLPSDPHARPFDLSFNPDPSSPPLINHACPYTTIGFDVTITSPPPCPSFDPTSPDVIAKKIKRCKTDLVKGLTFDDPERPECHNLLTLYSILSGKSKEVVAAECADLGWGQFKPMLTEVTIESLKPIQEKYAQIREDKDYLATVLRQGRLKAEAVANQTLDRVKNAMGYLPPF